MPISTDSMTDSFTTNVEETTIKPTDTSTARTEIISEGTTTEGFSLASTTLETTSSEESATYSSNAAYTTSSTAEIPSTDESTTVKSSVAYTVPGITTESDISITSTPQSTARGTTVENSETTIVNPSTTIFPSTEALATTVKTTEKFTEGSTSTMLSSTTTESFEGDLTSASTGSTPTDTTVVSTSTMAIPTTTPKNTASEDFTSFPTTLKSTSGQSTFLLSTTSESILTEYSTQRESTTEEVDNATKSPTQRAIQQVEDFIKENYIYFIIGCVLAVICSVFFSILIYRKCVKSHKGEKKAENLESWHPRRDQVLATANHLSKQNRNNVSSIASSSVGQMTYSNGYRFYKHVKRSK